VLVALAWPIAVLIDAVAWAAGSVVIGLLAAHRPLTRLGHPRGLLVLRPFERAGGGRWYERWWRVKAWKDLVPDAGTVGGNLTKRHLPDAAAGGTARFALECERAERAHWGMLALTPVFVVWNPGWLFAAMVAYGLVANGPCLVVLRYNRARLAAVAARQAAHSTLR
jgi:glycosyl-4,4'-diaponeurosporenoate acyltransferase